MDCRNRLAPELQFLVDLSNEELETLFDVATTAEQGSSIFTGLAAEVVGAPSQAIVERGALIENIEELNTCRAERARNVVGAFMGAAALGPVGALGGYFLSRRNSSTAVVAGVAGAALGLLLGGALASRFPV